MAKMDIEVRTEMYLEDFYVRYVIFYINGGIVQGHRVYCLASRVNIFFTREGSKGNIYLSYASFNRCFYHHVCLAFSHQFRSCGELLDIVNEMDDIHWIILCSEFYGFQLYGMIDIQ